MEIVIRQIISEFIEKYKELKISVEDENGMIKGEFQKTILSEFQILIEELENKLQYNMFGLRNNRYSGILKKLYIFYYILDERIYNYLTDLMKEKPSWKLEAQIRLYMMYLKTFRETIYLLTGGFSDCALSRTRRLYEIGVYLEIINKNDEILAERFCKHCNTQRYDIAQKINNQQSVKKIVHQVKKFNYEKEFTNNNGWANTIIKDKKTISFHDLIELTDYKIYEGFYKYSCNFVHPNLLSSLSSLDLTQDAKGKNIWNTSPSDEGIDQIINILRVYLGMFRTNYSNSFNTDVLIECLIFTMIVSNDFWDEFIKSSEEFTDETT